ncbi:hypothetical protein N2152v2_008238 [Parachlorella kessleri]
MRQSYLFDSIKSQAAIKPAFNITVVSDGEGPLDLYCNCADEGGDQSQHGLLIRPGDYAGCFHGEGQSTAGDPHFVCSVRNPGEREGPSVAFELQVRIYSMLYEDLYARCCQAPGACAPLVSASPGGVVDDCAIEGWSCNGAGQVLIMNATGFGMECDFPADVLKEFNTLEGLHLANNNLTGNFDGIATELASGLQGLRALTLSGNPGITGELAQASEDGVCLLVKGNLTRLDVSGAGLTGTLPACLFQEDSSALVELYAAHNRLTGELPDSFANSTKLQHLDLGHNELGGPVPESLAYVRALREVDLAFNEFNQLPDFNSETTPNLATLIMSGNELQGTVPQGLAEHKSLQVLDLGGNALTALPQLWLDPGAAAAAVAATTSPLMYLQLSGNKLTGPFPAGLALYPDLVFLFLEGNSLQGTLPDLPGGGFGSLHVLDASHNQLSGNLTDSWSQIGMFTEQPPFEGVENVFNMSYNQLSGDVPAWLSAASVNSLAWNISIVLLGNAFDNACAPDFAGMPEVCPPADTGEESGEPEASQSAGGPSTSSAAIAGTVVGVLAALGLAAGVLFYVKRRRQRDARVTRLGSGAKFKRFEEGMDDFAHPPGHVELSPQFADPFGPPGSERQSFHYQSPRKL